MSNDDLRRKVDCLCVQARVILNTNEAMIRSLKARLSPVDVARPAGSTAAGTVIVVDDHFDTCDLLVRMIETLGHPALCVESGPELLALLKRIKASMVILDVMMPDMNGFEVLRQLRADPASRDLPVVMHSARTDDDTRATALREGAQAFIAKGHTTFAQIGAIVQQYAG